MREDTGEMRYDGTRLEGLVPDMVPNGVPLPSEHTNHIYRNTSPQSESQGPGRTL
jgi:hypothetical protein